MSSDPKAAIASKFLDSLINELVLDTALDAHATVKRARAICTLCGLRCRIHTPAAGHAISGSTLSDEASGSKPRVESSGSQTSKPDYYSNNPLFECLVCSRQVSSNRYATHLAKCMGMGSKGGRKGAARTAKASTHNSTPNRFGTPKYSSDLDDDTFVKKSKLKGSTNADGDKRALSPFSASSLSSARISKKVKTNSPTPPPSDLLSGNMVRSHSSQPFAPSGLSNSTVLNGSPLNPLNNKRNSRAGSESLLQQDTSLTSKMKGRSVNSNGATSTNGTKRKRREVEDSDEDGEDSFKDPNSEPNSDDDFNMADGQEDGEISEEDVALAIHNEIRSNQQDMTIDGSDDDEEDDDDDDEDDDDDDASAQLTGSQKQASSQNKTGSTAGGLQRERGSDGEFIDVESASEQSDNESF